MAAKERTRRKKNRRGKKERRRIDRTDGRTDGKGIELGRKGACSRARFLKEGIGGGCGERDRGPGERRSRRMHTTRTDRVGFVSLCALRRFNRRTCEQEFRVILRCEHIFFYARYEN